MIVPLSLFVAMKMFLLLLLLCVDRAAPMNVYEYTDCSCYGCCSIQERDTERERETQRDTQRERETQSWTGLDRPGGVPLIQRSCEMILEFGPLVGSPGFSLRRVLGRRMHGQSTDRILAQPDNAKASPPPLPLVDCTALCHPVATAYPDPETMVNCNALLSAACFFTSNVMRLVNFIRRYERGHFDMTKLQSFDADFIKAEFDHRENRWLLIRVAGIINLFAWYFFIPPLMSLIWHMSKGGSRKAGIHTAMGIFALVGAFAEVLARLLLFGFETGVYWITDEFDLDSWLPSGIAKGTDDNLGWKALQMIFLCVEGAWMFGQP